MKLIKHIFFVLFFILLFFELIKSNISFFDFKPLKGVVVDLPKPSLTLDNWLNGSYQEEQLKFFEHKLNTRPFLVRFRNQIGYSLFDETSVKSLVLGKNYFLFEKWYIDSYLGEGYVGEDVINNKTNALLYVQQELKKRNIDLIFLLAPSKASYVPEYLPTHYNLSTKKRNNHDGYSEAFKKQHIQHIDFTNYFLKLKATIPHALFTNGGVHWSGYGATVAADTLVKYMEQLRNINMVDFYTTGGEESTIPRETDGDASKLLNLMSDFPSQKMYYPTIVFKKDSNKVKPNVLLVGDSFVWSFITFYPYYQNLFDTKSAFWGYNREIVWSSDYYKQNTPVASLNLKEETLHRDFIIIVNTETNLDNAGQYFIEEMLQMLQTESAIEQIKEVSKKN
jgi:SGNH hydrolase-like domain, acetyltransferase AlgX